MSASASPPDAQSRGSIRSKNVHWKIREILRRHWLAVGERHGVTTPDGRGVRFVIDDLADRTPQVIRAVRAQLPTNFPEDLVEPIFSGLQEAANRIAK